MSLRSKRGRHQWVLKPARHLSGVWKRVFQHLAADADNEYAMIDSTIVRAHQRSAGAQKDGADQAIGRSRGGLGTKIHTMVDALGNPVGFHLTGGEAHDMVGADHLLPDMQAEVMIADKAFDADGRVIEPLAAAGKTAVIPPKANRKSPRDYVTVPASGQHDAAGITCAV